MNTTTTMTTEKSFRRHYRSWVIPRIRVGVQIQMALHLLFGSLELICGYTAGAVMGVLCLRLAIMVSLTTFSWITLDKKFHKIMDALTLGFYTVSRMALRHGARVGSGEVLLPRWCFRRKSDRALYWPVIRWMALPRL